MAAHSDTRVRATEHYDIISVLNFTTDEDGETLRQESFRALVFDNGEGTL